MLIFDRIVLTMLALGVWALVLSPQGTHSHPNDYHLCKLSGYAIGEVVSEGASDPASIRGPGVLVEGWNNVLVDCSHY